MKKTKFIITLILTALVLASCTPTNSETSDGVSDTVSAPLDTSNAVSESSEESKVYTETETVGNRETVREYRDGKNDYTVTVTTKNDDGEPEEITIRDYKLGEMTREVIKQFSDVLGIQSVRTTENLYENGKVVKTNDQIETNEVVESQSVTEYDYNGDALVKKTKIENHFSASGEKERQVVEVTEYDGTDVKTYTECRYDIIDGAPSLSLKKIDEPTGSKVFDKDEKLVLTYEVTGDTSGVATYYRNDAVVMKEEVDGKDRPSVTHTIFDAKDKVLVFTKTSGKVTLTEAYIDGASVTTNDDAVKVFNEYTAIRGEFNIYSTALVYEFYSFG